MLIVRDIYLIQPYPVGSKNSKSLAIVIPSEIAKKLQIDTSTVFVLKSTDEGIFLNFVDIDKNKRTKPVGVSLPTDSQQVEC